MSPIEEDIEIVECRECGTGFNLTAQYYYDNLCPSCKKKENPDANKVPCTVCSNRVAPDEVQQAKYVGRGPTEMVPVCSDSCARDARTPPWAP